MSVIDLMAKSQHRYRSESMRVMESQGDRAKCAIANGLAGGSTNRAESRIAARRTGDATHNHAIREVSLQRIPETASVCSADVAPGSPAAA